MSNHRPAAKTTKEGYVQIYLTQPPGCLARVEAWLRQAAWAGAWFAAGVMVGLVLRGF
jgi:hypothetical protein